MPMSAGRSLGVLGSHIGGGQPKSPLSEGPFLPIRIRFQRQEYVLGVDEILSTRGLSGEVASQLSGASISVQMLAFG